VSLLSAFLSSLLLFLSLFFCHLGDFKVNADFPDGAFLVENLTRTQLQETLFSSMPLALYFTVVTLTTLGFGDMTPSTTGGRAIACVLAG
jgi:hypothetical protein